MIRPSLSALLACAALSTMASEGPAGNDVGEENLVRARYLMGTIFRFEALPGPDASATERSLEMALDEVQRLEDVISNWRSESELSALNRRSGSGPVHVTQDLFEVVEASLQWASETDGRFDPTVETLTRRFRNGADLPSTPTSASPGPGVLPGVGWRRVRISSDSKTVSLPANAGIDLGGIGKGFALDKAAAVLLERGVSIALLDAGGQILALGAPPGSEGWPIGVADPTRRQIPRVELLLRDASAATSGNAERPGEIVDPFTGKSLMGAYSATAIAASGTAADALSTAMFVMGPRVGKSWAMNRSDVRVLFLEPTDSDESVRASGTLPGVSPGQRIVLSGSRPSREGFPARRLSVAIR